MSEAATWDPTLWRTWNALGQALDSLGRWSEARTAYEQAMWGAPDPARIHNNLGMSFLRSGDGARAIDHFGTALQLDADLAVAQANLRLALAFEGNYVEALSGFRKKSCLTFSITSATWRCCAATILVAKPIFRVLWKQARVSMSRLGKICSTLAICAIRSIGSGSTRRCWKACRSSPSPLSSSSK